MDARERLDVEDEDARQERLGSDFLHETRER